MKPLLVIRRATGKATTWVEQRESVLGYLFAMPWLIGFLGLTMIPVVLSFYYSFTRFDVLRPPMWVGLENYSNLLFEDSKFYKAIWNTVYFTALRVPLVVIGSLLLAMLVARPRPGVGVLRTVYYMPSIVSGVALSVIWLWMYNPQYGLVNQALALFSVPGPLWLDDPRWSKDAIILMGIWSIGGGRMILFIAGLNGIPRHLYESARVDGAGWWTQFVHITLPQLSGIIFLIVVVEIIGCFQVFTEAYLMTAGGPLDSTLFYNLQLYYKAFQDYEMGEASAMAWILFVLTMAVTLLLFKGLGRFVYYEGER